MLLAIPQMTEEKAITIVNNYPSLCKLMEGYQVFINNLNLFLSNAQLMNVI